MAYVDLNPIRANMAKSLPESEHTSIKRRLKTLSPDELNQTIKAIAGKVKNSTMVLKLKDYIELVEWTGNTIIYPNQSKLPSHLSTTFERLNLQKNNSLNQVQSFGGNYYRFVGNLDKLKEKMKQLGRHWLKGIKPIQSLYKPPPQ